MWIMVPIQVIIDIRKRTRQVIVSMDNGHEKLRLSQDFHFYSQIVKEHYHDRRN